MNYYRTYGYMSTISHKDQRLGERTKRDREGQSRQGNGQQRGKWEIDWLKRGWSLHANLNAPSTWT